MCILYEILFIFFEICYPSQSYETPRNRETAISRNNVHSSRTAGIHMQRRHFRMCIVSSIKLVCNQFLLTLDKIIETSNILLSFRIFSLFKRILSKVDVKAFYFNPEIHLKAPIFRCVIFLFAIYEGCRIF